MGIDSHGNNGHSHSHTGCFPFLPIPIPNFVTNSHYHGNPMGFPFPLGIPFPWSLVKCDIHLLQMCFFLALCSAMSPTPRCRGRLLWDFDTWLQMCALRQCRSRNLGEPPPKNFGAVAFFAFRRKISKLRWPISVKICQMTGNRWF